MDWPASAFWDYSLAVYARPGVEAACLALQERHGTDVNLVLLACWLGSRGVALGRDHRRRLAAAVEDWQHDVIQPLRAVRRRLKAHLAQAESGTVAACWPSLGAALRRRARHLELDGEHLEQLTLAQMVDDLPADAPPGIALASANLRAVGNFDPADRQALSTLLGAAFPGARLDDATLSWLEG